jgi:GNAT superfamily N-acetyltransferase
MRVMDSSELRLTRRATLTPSELADVEALVRQANWNQIEADWLTFLAHGNVYAVCDGKGRIVASTATLPFGGRFAWISMVLVDAGYRRRGLATQLMRRAMDDLAAGGLLPVLDATPDGRAVYRALGFQESWGYHRLLRREPRAAVTPSPAADLVIRPLTDTDWGAVRSFDACAFGADRGAVLASLRGRLPAADLVAERDGRLAGFLLGRDGRLAGHCGPLIADDDAAAVALLAHALEALPGPLFIDLADTQVSTRAFLTAQGFAPVRPLTRMLLGTSARFDDARRTFAVIGPEFG